MGENVKDRIERELPALTNLDRNPHVSPHLLADAEHVARYFKARYLPTKDGGRELPGLVDMKLAPTVGEDILYLVDTIAAVNLALYRERAPFPLERVRAIVADLQVFLRWLAGDAPALEVQLDNLRTAHGRARRVGEWMVSLTEHALLGRTHEAALRAIPAFPATLFDEADALIAAHRANADDGHEALVSRRAAYVALLLERMRRVLKAADALYRHVPEVARAARSPRERARIAASVRARRLNREAPRASDPPAPTEPHVPPETPAASDPPA